MVKLTVDYLILLFNYIFINVKVIDNSAWFIATFPKKNKRKNIFILLCAETKNRIKFIFNKLLGSW